jgi:hypothetical protein
MSDTQEKKTIQLYVDNIGRKNKYLAVRSEYGGIVPAIYFRKSKWISDDDYREIVNFLLEKGMNS